MKIRWRPSLSFSFCFIFLLCKGAVGDSVTCQSTPAQLGLLASLTCTFQDPSTVSQSIWTRCNDSSRIGVFNKNFGTNIKEPYQGRVKIQEYHTLTLVRVQEEDFGLYCCTIITYPHGSIEGRVHLLKLDQTPNSERSAISMKTIIYIICGVTGFIILVGISTTGLVYLKKKRTIRNPVHVTLRSSSVNPHQHSVLQKDPHKSDDEDEGLYLNVTSST